MEKKNIIISSIITGLVLIGAGAYFTVANDDYTCYTYTSTANSCSSNKTNCTDWIGGKRTCQGTNTITYTRGAAYACADGNADTRSRYSLAGTCSFEDTDVIAPTVTSGGIQ